MNDMFTKIVLVIIAIGIWVNIYTPKKVEVLNSTLDINIEEINGRSDVFYEDTDGANMVLPVSIRNNN